MFSRCDEARWVVALFKATRPHQHWRYQFAANMKWASKKEHGFKVAS